MHHDLVVGFSLQKLGQWGVEHIVASENLGKKAGFPIVYSENLIDEAELLVGCPLFQLSDEDLVEPVNGVIEQGLGYLVSKGWPGCAHVLLSVVESQLDCAQLEFSQIVLVVFEGEECKLTAEGDLM